jgi:hypothetical protein
MIASLGGIGWFVLSKAPVQSRIEVDLTGSWPPPRAITLAYFDNGQFDPLREIRAFPPTGVRSIDDEPELTPGSYRLEVRVETDEGTHLFTRILEHEQGSDTRFELRFGED